MPVSGVVEFLAARRRLGIEPAGYIFRRAAERLRNALEAVAFAGHALRSHQLLERPWRMRCAPARLASCGVRHCGLLQSQMTDDRDQMSGTRARPTSGRCHPTSDISHLSRPRFLHMSVADIVKLR